MKVIYVGTFDPITNGHFNVIQRAAKLFDEVLVAVAHNPSKRPLFHLEERVALVEASCAAFGNVQVKGFSGLLADFARAENADALVRGIRGGEDIEYEIQLAQLNDKLASGLETIFLPPSVEWRFLSSTMVREVFKHNGEVAQFVPPPVAYALQQRKQGE